MSEFQNTYTAFRPKSLAEVLRWRREARRQARPRPPQAPIRVVRPDLEFLHRNAKAGPAMQPAVTWIGHATVLAQLGGINMLTDPIFSNRASPFGFIGPKRHVAPGVVLDDLPHIDLIVVSHNHYDHLDAASVDAFQRQPGGPPVVIAPLGLRAWFASRGIDSVELDWWQSHRFDAPVGPMEAMLVPAQHWSGRGLTDQMKTLWGGFAVFAPDCHLFFAGDTAYSRDFLDMRERFNERQSLENGGGFDMALLPIGAYEPRWFMASQHVNVEEALKIHDDLRAKRSLGIHWGTFELSDEALDDPPREVARLQAVGQTTAEEFFTMAIGETRMIPARQSL